MVRDSKLAATPGDRDSLIEEIASRVRVKAEPGRSFAQLTSLRVGGAIDWVLSPASEEQAANVVFELDSAGIPCSPLVSGSNVLGDEADHNYGVVSLKELKGKAIFESDRASV